MAARDSATIDEARRISNFGMHERIAVIDGCNAKLSEYHGVVGLVQLDRWQGIKQRRRAVFQRYRAALAKAGLPLAFQYGAEDALIGSLMLRAEQPAAGTIINALNERGILAHRMYLPPLYHHPYFAGLAAANGDGRMVPGAAPLEQKTALMENGEFMQRTVFGLPFHSFLDEHDIAFVAEALAAAMGKNATPFRPHRQKRDGVMERVDTIVVGAGVIGLAVARALAQRGREVLILESENAIGSITSSRNSGVIHAGIYYQPGSLKARCCVKGRDMLYAYAAERGIAHKRCGKLVVATDERPDRAAPRLEKECRTKWRKRQFAPAHARRSARDLEPDVSCTAALHVPVSGIVDVHELMLALLGDSEAKGATLVLQSPVKSGAIVADGFVLDVGGAAPMQISCRTLVNAAGLGAQKVCAKICGKGLDPATIPPLVLAKGQLFQPQRQTAVQNVDLSVAGIGLVRVACDVRSGGAHPLRAGCRMGRKHRLSRRSGARAACSRMPSAAIGPVCRKVSCSPITPASAPSSLAPARTIPIS